MNDLPSRLDAEWHHLACSRAAATALHRWHRLEPALAPHHDLESLRTTAHTRTDPATADVILAALARLAAVDGHNDPLATRVLLQLLLPGAIRLARTLTPMLGDHHSTQAAVLAELTIRIRTYPWQRRPRKIAANLLLDTRQRLTRHHRRTDRETATGLDLPAVDDAAADQPDTAVGLHDLLTWAQRHGVLTDFEAQLLVASHVAEIPMAQLATAYGRSRSHLYATRTAAEQRLRHALTATRTPGARDL